MTSISDFFAWTSPPSPRRNTIGSRANRWNDKVSYKSDLTAFLNTHSAMYYSCCWRMRRTAESAWGRKKREERGGHFTLNQYLVSLSLQLRSNPSRRIQTLSVWACLQAKDFRLKPQKVSHLFWLRKTWHCDWGLWMSPNNQGSARLAIFVSSWTALVHLKCCAFLREFLRSTRRNVRPDRTLSYTITYNYLSRPSHLMWSVVILQFWLTKTVLCLLFDTSSICVTKFWLRKIKSLLLKIGFPGQVLFDVRDWHSLPSGLTVCQSLAINQMNGYHTNRNLSGL